MKTFAGFWRDGAEVKPEASHCDSTGYVVAMNKKTGEYCCKALPSPRSWKGVYWLDTTTPTKLTPQEAFELVKITYPNAKYIRQGYSDVLYMDDDAQHIINWGDTTEYPIEQKWRVPTDADKGERCRFRNHVDKDWTEIESAKFMCTWRDGFMVEYITGSPASWKYCEVLDE
jgi:hypothetical protein